MTLYSPNALEAEPAYQWVRELLQDSKDPFSESVGRWQDRQEACNQIAVRAAEHAVCTGCDCIFIRGSTTDVKGVCPICHHYRFDTTVGAVLTQTEVLRGRSMQVVLPADMLGGGRHN